MKNLFNLLTSLCIAITLAACGGGGGGNSSATPNTDAQGFWTGTSSGGYTVTTAVLDNGEVWGIYSAGSTIYGALFGTSSVSGSTITVTGTDFDFLVNTATAGTLAGPVVAKSTMTLANAKGSVPMIYRTSYDTPATSSAIAGTWSFVGRSGSYTLVPATITINSTGNFTLVQSTCTTSGAIVPRTGGKNVYNITLTLSGIGCAAGQSTLSGILIIDTTVTPNKFLSLALTPSKNDGLIVMGTKM